MKLVRMSDQHRYKTSRDYELLFVRMKDTPVICIVDYLECRDITSTIFDGSTSQVSSRGCCHVHADSSEDFIKQCKSLNLEFVVY